MGFRVLGCFGVALCCGWVWLLAVVAVFLYDLV